MLPVAWASCSVRHTLLQLHQEKKKGRGKETWWCLERLRSILARKTRHTLNNYWNLLCTCTTYFHTWIVPLLKRSDFRNAFRDHLPRRENPENSVPFTAFLIITRSTTYFLSHVCFHPLEWISINIRTFFFKLLSTGLRIWHPIDA